MAAFQAFGMSDQPMERECLDYPSYFTSMVLVVYDNILGPTILKVWVGKQTASNGEITDSDKKQFPEEPSDLYLHMIASYSIKDEVGRENKITGIETKFYALEKMDLIACSYIFRAPLKGGKMSVFGFFVTLPYKEITEFMPRYLLCESNVHRLLSKHLISRMELQKYERPSRDPISEQVSGHLPNFKNKLSGLCQVMLTVRSDSLPSYISIEDTFLGAELNDKNDFLINAITCHLQLGGYSVVFGDEKNMVTKMINTLALFLSEKERKVCRGVSAGKRYIADLYLQGYIKKDGISPFPLECLWRNKFPTTVIDMDKFKVYCSETTVPAYLRKRDEDSAGKSVKNIEDMQEFDKGKDGKIIKEYVRQLVLLPDTGGVREAFTNHFVRTLKLKAVSICKYLESELPNCVNQDGEGAVRGEEGEPKINKEVMMAELGLSDSHMDHLVLLCFVEKMRPNSYKDIIGDPQKDIEKILTDLEFV